MQLYDVLHDESHPALEIKIPFLKYDSSDLFEGINSKLNGANINTYSSNKYNKSNNDYNNNNNINFNDLLNINLRPILIN